jgi:hypothetical protein
MATRKPLTIKLADIDVSDRIQPLDEAKAQEIATSFTAHGQLINRIGMRQTPNGTLGWALIHGRHRLRALEIVGLTELVEGTHFERVAVEPAQARLMEIEENMARTDVSPFGRAVMLVAYRDALGLDGRGGDRRSDDFKSANSGRFEKLTEGFVAHAMQVFDLQLRDVGRLIQIGTKLTAPAGLSDRLHFSRIARNQSQLLKLAALPPEQLERAADAFDATGGDFYNLMAILAEAPARQAAMLRKLKAGAAIGEVVEDTKPVQTPAHDYWQQAISSYSRLSHKHRVSATVEYFKQDQKAVREALKFLGYDLVKTEAEE